MRHIGVVTTGGDAPGMNAAIRAIVRLANARSIEVQGFERGWEGLINNSHQVLTSRSVGGILQLGGTILRTSRCPEFRTREGQRKASETLALNGIDGLVVIGGNGSFRGALELSEETEASIVGIPATIDNDVFGTEETIGFDTAVNTAVSEIDKIRDTAISHERIFVVEVMGRKRGFLALTVGLTVGAEVIMLPEVKIEREVIFDTIEKNTAKGKRSGIVVVAEGADDTYRLAGEIEKNTGAEVRLSVLGYAQRGGNPTARSRLLANLFAEKAIDVLSERSVNGVVGLQNGNMTVTELEQSCSSNKPLNLELLRLANTLAT